MKKLAPLLLALSLFLGASCESDGYSSDAGSGVEPWPKPATTLQAAIQIAQKKFPDARCTEAGYSDRSGSLVCTVVLVQGDQRHDLQLDEQGGVTSSTDAPLDTETRGVLEAYGKLAPGIGMLQAGKSAMDEESGYWTMAAGLGNERGTILYQVLLVKGQKSKVARVSAANGRVDSVQDLDGAEMR